MVPIFKGVMEQGRSYHFDDTMVFKKRTRGQVQDVSESDGDINHVGKLGKTGPEDAPTKCSEILKVLDKKLGAAEDTGSSTTDNKQSTPASETSKVPKSSPGTSLDSQDNSVGPEVIFSDVAG